MSEHTDKRDDIASNIADCLQHNLMGTGTVKVSGNVITAVIDNATWTIIVSKTRGVK